MEIINTKNSDIAVYYKNEFNSQKTEPIILIHGFTGSCNYHFRYEIEYYPKTFQTIVLGWDLPGHGNSPANEFIKTNSFDFIVEDLKFLLDHYEIEKCTLFGASFGGLIANLFIEKYPERVKRLILMSTTPSHSKGLIRSLNNMTRMYQLYLDNPEAILPAKMDQIMKLHASSYEKITLQQKFLRYMISTYTTDWSLINVLKGVTVPTLIIHGDKDYIELENAVNTFKAIKNSSLFVIPNVGHLPQLKYPKLVENEIIRFIKQNQD